MKKIVMKTILHAKGIYYYKMTGPREGLLIIK